jgi:hypothetical protein
MSTCETLSASPGLDARLAFSTTGAALSRTAAHPSVLGRELMIVLTVRPSRVGRCNRLASQQIGSLSDRFQVSGLDTQSVQAAPSPCTELIPVVTDVIDLFAREQKANLQLKGNSVCQLVSPPPVGALAREGPIAVAVLGRSPEQTAVGRAASLDPKAVSVSGHGWQSSVSELPE